MSNSHRNTSDLRLEAMLYLLNDPSLDRSEFEQRLADDSQLAEILADSVSLLHSLRSLDIESRPMVQPANPNGVMSPVPSPRPVAATSSRPSWLVVSGLAASLLIAGFVGLKLIPRLTSSLEVAHLDNSASSTLDSTDLSNGERNSWNNVVWAWGEMRSDERDDHPLRHVHFIESENGLALSDSSNESDVPEWLILATAAVLEDGAGIGGAVDELETRTLIQ